MNISLIAKARFKRVLPYKQATADACEVYRRRNKFEI